MLWTVTMRKASSGKLPGITLDVEAKSKAEALRQVQGTYPIKERWLYEVKRKEGGTNGTHPTPPPPTAPQPPPMEVPVEAPVVEEKPTPPTRTGSVRVCVPLSGGVGVVAITSVTKAGEVTKRYLIKCLGHNKFSLTGFVDDGGGYYTIVVNDTPYCACEDHKRHGHDCKHIRACRSLIAQGKV